MTEPHKRVGCADGGNVDTAAMDYGKATLALAEYLSARLAAGSVAAIHTFGKLTKNHFATGRLKR